MNKNLMINLAKFGVLIVVIPWFIYSVLTIYRSLGVISNESLAVATMAFVFLVLYILIFISVLLEKRWGMIIAVIIGMLSIINSFESFGNNFFYGLGALSASLVLTISASYLSRNFAKKGSIQIK